MTEENCYYMKWSTCRAQSSNTSCVFHDTKLQNCAIILSCNVQNCFARLILSSFISSFVQHGFCWHKAFCSPYSFSWDVETSQADSNYLSKYIPFAVDLRLKELSYSLSPPLPPPPFPSPRPNP